MRDGLSRGRGRGQGQGQVENRKIFDHYRDTHLWGRFQELSTIIGQYHAKMEETFTIETQRNKMPEKQTTDKIKHKQEASREHTRFLTVWAANTLPSHSQYPTKFPQANKSLRESKKSSSMEASRRTQPTSE